LAEKNAMKSISQLVRRRTGASFFFVSIRQTGEPDRHIVTPEKQAFRPDHRADISPVTKLIKSPSTHGAKRTTEHNPFPFFRQRT